MRPGRESFEFTGEEFATCTFRDVDPELAWLELNIRGRIHKIWRHLADTLCDVCRDRHHGSVIKVETMDGWVTGLKFEKVDRQGRFSMALKLEYSAG